MSRHLISTRAEPETCRRCGAPVLVGLAEGLPARVDVAELDRAGELAALIGNRRTYTLLVTGELVYRSASRIAGGFLRGAVYAEHNCGSR